MTTALQCTSLPGGRRSFSPKSPAYALIVGGNDSACVLLLHCDAEHNQQIIPNDAAYGLPKLLTSYKRARIVHDDARFGVGSLYCDGAGAYVKVGPSPDWFFGTQPWSVDFWANVIDTSRPYLFAWYLDADNFLALEVVNFIGNRVRFQVRYRAAGQTLLLAENTRGYPLDHVAVNGWHHFALTFEDKPALLIDGNRYAMDLTTGVDINLEDWPLYIGAAPHAGGGPLQCLRGYIDEFRVMRKTNPFRILGFTPPGNPYSLRALIGLRGAYDIRWEQTITLRGLYGVEYHPYTRRLAGTHNVRQSRQQSLRGRHYIRTVLPRSLQGVYGCVLHPYTRGLRGWHRVARGYTRGLRGSYTGLSGRYTIRLAGTHTVRGGWTRALRGMYQSLYRFARRLAGVHRVEDTDLDRYELFYGDGAPPDLTGAPWETFTSLPHETATITGEGLHYFVVRERTRWGLASENVTAFEIELDGSDDEIMQAPSDWLQMAIVPAAAASARVQAIYDYTADGDRAADKWAIYITSNGDDPDPGTDPPTLVDMVKTHGFARLDWRSPEYDDQDMVKVLVRTYRTSPSRASTSTTIKQTTVTTDAPDPPEIGGEGGGYWY